MKRPPHKPARAPQATADPRALEALGLSRRAEGRLEDAVAAYQESIRLDPAAFGPRFNLGNAFHAMARFDEAVASYRRALAADAGQAGGWNNLGDALWHLEQTQDALSAYRAAVLLQPEVAEFQFNLGRAAFECEAWAESERALTTAITLRPDFGVAYLFLGRVHEQTQAWQPAAEHYATAVRLLPGDPVARNCLIPMLQRFSRLDEAVVLAREVLALLPDSAAAHANLASLLLDAGALAEAEVLLRRALDLDATLRGIRYTLSMVLLTGGRWREGFTAYDGRWSSMGFPRPVPPPYWDGTPAPGKTILVHAEQGFGDQIQFCRFLPRAAARCARLLVQATAPMRRLLESIDAPFTLYEGTLAEAPPGSWDLACGMGDLPSLLEMPDDVPPNAPYLRADPEAVTAWRARLAPLPGRTVGLAWAGNPDQPMDHLRSLPFAALAPLAEVAGVGFVSLQLGGADWTSPPQGQQPDLQLSDWTDELGDFADTAALIVALDLVITVDTAVAHLAGALGKPVWLLNRSETDWRWMRDRSDSIWYPSMRIFRQPSPGQWEPVIAAVTAALVSGSV